MSKTRSRLPHEVHDKIFGWVLALVAGHDLVKAERIGVDGSTMEANAALRTIVRRDSGETYRDILTRMAQESSIDTPTADDLVRLDRKRKGKKMSDADWESPTDPDAKVSRMKNGSTRLGSARLGSAERAWKSQSGLARIHHSPPFQHAF
jgi:transposase